MTTWTCETASRYNTDVPYAIADSTVDESVPAAARRDEHMRARVVLCGSMSSMSLMMALREQLCDAGIDTVVPEVDRLSPHASTEQMLELKRSASLAHMAMIKAPQTAAVLVANIDKDGRCDYVGPNAFAEIAVAVAEDRPVYLWGGMPEDLRDELDAWQVCPLNGDLGALVTTLSGRASRSRTLPGSRRAGDGQGELYS